MANHTGVVEPPSPASVALVSMRAHLLAFSVPYLWSWTAGLGRGTQLAATLAHAGAVLAWAGWDTAVDAARGVPAHRALATDARRLDARLAGQLAPGWALLGALAAVPLAMIDALLVVGVVLLLGTGWVLAHLPPHRKELLVPELTLPALLLVVPALALDWRTDATPRLSTAVAGAAMLAALLLAQHLRDRAADLAAGVPTLATRRPGLARNWLWISGVAGALAALMPLYRPLDVAEQLAVAGAVGLLAALPLNKGRVPAIAAAHGLFACTVLLGAG